MIKKFVIILISVLVLSLMVSLFIVNKIDKLEKKDTNLFQYINSYRIEYKGKVEFAHDQGVTTIFNDNKKYQSTSIPVYYNDEEKIILPLDMSIVSSLDGSTKKVSHYSEIYRNEFKTVIKSNKDIKETTRSFLYDGDNTYVFLSKVKLKFGDITYILDPMSYVKVADNGVLEVYINSEKVYKTHDVSGVEVFAYDDDINVKVDLKSDKLYFNDKQQLLLKNISDLQKF